MEYKTYEPAEKLAANIKCYWSLTDDSSEALPKKERVFPDGCIELIFHYGDLYKKHHATGNVEIQSRAFLHGQITRYIELEPTGKTGIFSVRFHPSGLHSFTKYDITNATNTTVPVEELWPEKGKALEQKMINASNDTERIGIIEDFLYSQWILEKNDPLIMSVVDRVIREQGMESIDEIISCFPLSKRQLERRFLSQTGLSIKVFTRIIRFNYILQLIQNRDFSSLTAIAYEGGFYDQSHFIKDFKEFTGWNPKQYFSNDPEFVKLFNL